MPKFRTLIDGNEPGGAWAMIAIPAAVPREIGASARTPVYGTINGYAFRTSILPRADGTFYMMVNREMRLGARANPGDAVDVVIERDDKPRDVDVPEELVRALRENDAAKSCFDALSYAHRKEYADWIATAKQDATRLRRAEKAVAMLADGKALKP
ncbi:MAG TPA: YdeI/OmpD-associated family protein [Dehalococcoidia bacterium]